MSKVIVQVGACVGEDHVSSFKEEDLYLVEPNLNHTETLEKQYPNSVIVCNAIVPSSKVGSVEIWYSKDDGPKFEVASFKKEHILKHGYSEDSLSSFSTEGVTLEELLTALNLTKVDILFLDIEGMEEEVLLEFPFDRFYIDAIQVEKLHLKDEAGLDNHLVKFGYTKTQETYDFHGFDILYKKA